MKSETYYRKITESFPQGILKEVRAAIKQALKKENLKFQALHFSLLFLVVLFIFLLIQSVLSYFQYVQATDKREEISSGLTYWEKVVRDNPAAPDAYYQAGFYSAELFENKKAQKYLQKAIELDPSFEEAIELEKIIETR